MFRRLDRVLAMKIVVAVVVALGALAGSAHAQSSEKGVFGIGLVLGEPTGISAKLYLDDDTAVQAAVGSAWRGGGAQIHADYLWHPWILEQRDSFTLPAYIGPGLRFIQYNFGRQDAYFAVGVRGVVGICFDFTTIPLDVFVEVAGVAEWGFVDPDVGDEGFGLTFNAGAGGRYYF
jgi:hypothetical protein